jgi:hypothetical protein
VATPCIALSLVVFSLTFPVNRATREGIMAAGWEALRRQ